MAGNSTGVIFKLTTYGESHGEAIGGIIDGCPAGLAIDTGFIQSELNRRKPGQSAITTSRNETDIVKIVSGLFEGHTTGAPISFYIQNKDQKPGDYDNLKNVFRPSHADYTYQQKFGIRDHRGGGRSSARETISRVTGGAIAKQLLALNDITIKAYVSSVGDICMNRDASTIDLQGYTENMVRCPDTEIAARMEDLIMKTKQEGDSVGGVITCLIDNVPVGLGEPVFDKLHADLAKAMLSINAVKGFEYGGGFKLAAMKGSQANDAFKVEKGKVGTATNFSGGIQGGISNGERIYFKVAFKPVATIIKDQQTITTENEPVVMAAKGRHDPCVVPRAVVIVEAMAALVVADHLLRNKVNK